MGRELDELVLLRVFGTAKREAPVVVGVPGHERELWWKFDDLLLEEPPSFSSNAELALLLVEEMRERGWRFEAMMSEANAESESRFAFPGRECRAEFARYGFRRFRIEKLDGYAKSAPTLPHAICLAALAAVAASSTTAQEERECR